MRHSLLAIVFFAMTASSASNAAPIAAGTGAFYSGPGPAERDIPNGNAYRKHRAILALVREGKALQVADGGTLTAADHQYLQTKLNHIRAGNY